MRCPRFTDTAAALMCVPAAVVLAGALQAASLSVLTSVPASTSQPQPTPTHVPATLPVPR
jgi:hypothetical protein